ncbi:hypothetical protein [Micromonospora cathayae]|uniref:Uncharacterized protein n=1 Tax=Micromonospora cathayae TaxID=3028804 RepID=A0ABY7ZHZ2_9ACTN|nr:hypothetical protein [Micromonospora sp. HUAS 3]WDZ82457.1 hypothetical protein PVK37_18410 [Micromonospora sp. HUAS 3]
MSTDDRPAASTPEEPAGLGALRAWWRLPKQTRREVLALSRSGRRHSDPMVAWAAWRWAQTVLPVGAPEPGRIRNIASGAGFFALIAVELFLGGDPTDPPKPHWLDRRRARPILRLGPPLS